MKRNFESKHSKNCFQVLSHHQHTLTSRNNPPIKQQKSSHKCMHGENNKKHLQIFEVPIMLWNINIYVLNIKYIYLCAPRSTSYHSTMNICSILHPVLRASAKIFAFFTRETRAEELFLCCVGNKRKWCDEVEIIDKKHSNCDIFTWINFSLA